MTSTELKAQIDSQITNETTPNGITPTDVGTNMKEVVDYVDQQLAYNSYVAIINQSGTSAPVATVVFNNTGATFTWFYEDVGAYYVTSSSAILLNNKIVVFVTTQGNSGNSQDKIFGGVRSNDSNVSLFTSTNGIVNLNFEIRIYN